MPEPLWYALQVRGRQEAFVSELLRHKGYEVFLPEHPRSTPLFPGYVFCRFSLGAAGSLAVTTPGVTQIVKFGGRPAVLADEEINAIRTIAQSGLPARTYEIRYEPGARVFIESGPLAGVEGILLQKKSESQLVVSIPLLRRSLAVVIDASWAAVPAA